MKLAIPFSWLLCLLFVLVPVTAIPVTYTITLIGKNVTIIQHEEVREECATADDNLSFCRNSTILINETQEEPWQIAAVVDTKCDDLCQNTLPRIELPEGVMLTEAILEEDDAAYDVTFKRSKDRKTNDLQDKVRIEILGPVCDAGKCDASCAVCPDKSCHSPCYTCPSKEEYLSIAKIIPKNLSLGENQVNVLVKNSFGSSIENVAANISGFGITTTKHIPVVSIAPDDKDYVFLTLNATQYGDQDVIVRIEATLDGERIRAEFIDKLSVSRKEKQPVNETALTMMIADYRAALKSLELNYTEKKAEEYQLLNLEDTIRETKSLLLKAQTALQGENPEQANEYLAAVQFNLDDLRSNVENAYKPKRTIADFMKENIFWISTMITAILGAFALYEKQRQKMAVLKEKVKIITKTKQARMKAPKKAQKRKKQHRKATATQAPSAADAAAGEGVNG